MRASSSKLDAYIFPLDSCRRFDWLRRWRTRPAGRIPSRSRRLPLVWLKPVLCVVLVALRGQTRDVTSFLRLSTDRGIPASFPPSTTIIHQTPVSRPRLGRPSPVLRAPTSTFTQDLHRAEASGLPSSPTTRRRPPSLGKRPLAVDRRHYRTWRGSVSDVNVTRGEELLADLPACFMGIQFDQPGPPQNRYADPYSNRI